MHAFRKLFPLLALAAAACGQGPRDAPIPLDRFAFPTGLALTPLPGGGRALAVVSSNFDLRYSPETGGSVLVVDPEASTESQLAVLPGGALRIPSFGGSAVRLAGDTCAGWTGPTQLLVPSRRANALFRIDFGADGSLACGDGCRVDLDPTVADPFDVEVVCNAGGGAESDLRYAAYVSHLRSPSSSGRVTRVNLDPAANGAFTVIPMGPAPTQQFAYDAARQRLYVTSRFAVVDQTPLRWLELALRPDLVQSENLNDDIRGSELRDIVLSSDRTRAYVAVRLFDRDLVSQAGIRAPDVRGAVAVIDLSDGADGRPAMTVLRLVPIPEGPAEVALLPRADGRRDLVAVTSTDDGALTIYDDEAGAVATVIGGRDNPGGRDVALPFGRQPFGLATERTGPTTHRIFVGSFDRGWISVVNLDENAPSQAAVERRFGPEAP